VTIKHRRPEAVRVEFEGYRMSRAAHK
jgi:hypothetical protein